MSALRSQRTHDQLGMPRADIERSDDPVRAQPTLQRDDLLLMSEERRCGRRETELVRVGEQLGVVRQEMDSVAQLGRRLEVAGGVARDGRIARARVNLPRSVWQRSVNAPQHTPRAR